MGHDLHHVAHLVPRPAEVTGLHGGTGGPVVAEDRTPDLVEHRAVALGLGMSVTAEVEGLGTIEVYGR